MDYVSPCRTRISNVCRSLMSGTEDTETWTSVSRDDLHDTKPLIRILA